jgi:TolB protein
MFALAVAALLAWPARAATDVFIKVGGTGAHAALPLALAAFEGPEQAKEVREVVRSDLLLSRHFALIEEGPDWKARGANWVLAAKVTVSADLMTVSAQLKDTVSGEAAFDRYYKLDAKRSRALAHRISDDVVKQLTGKTGIAHSAIAFAALQGGHKELFVADYDGANVRQLTRFGSITLLPRFSPDRKRLAFTSYKDGNPDLFALELESGRLTPISKDQGLNVAGGFSPDGSQLLMTLSRQKSPNLYLKTFADGSLAQLTHHFGADSSPTFSPDAQQVAFVSDRSGNPQVYVLDLTTRRARRLTSFNWCDSPSWSPTGEWIAFSGRLNPVDKLDIYIVDVTGGQVRQLTHGEGSNENPSWSPDGRFLVFTSTRGGRSQLHVMDADGSAPHQLLDAPGAVSTVDWSR